MTLAVTPKPITIHYQVYGDIEKPALVLIFGISMSAQDWFDFGYVQRLQADFYIIAIDARGHGKSSAPLESGDYALSAMASDIGTVLNQLGVKQAIIWGYSLGAKMALAWAGSAPQRVSGLALGGFELHSQVDLSNDLVSQTLALGNHAWYTLWQQMFDVPSPLAKRLLCAHTPALWALRQAEAQWPDLTQAASSVNAPCILYAGENCFFRDAVCAMQPLFAHSRYLELPNHNHFSLMPDAKLMCDEVIATFSRRLRD